MINEILFMNGYGLYVWSAFAFTLLSFVSLYLITVYKPIKHTSVNMKDDQTYKP